MRAILAGLFSFVGLLVCVGVFFHYFPDGLGPTWLTGVWFALILFILLGLSQFLFNRSGYRADGKTAEERIADLEANGQLISKTFQATRAFQVEEFEDEGLHYFIELTDRSVLYLTGQYLYDYEQIEDDPEVNQPRQFPCTEFTVKRHKTDGYVVDIKVAGKLLPEECVAPSFDKQDVKRDLIPEDGQIFRDRSYDDLKRERLKGRAG